MKTLAARYKGNRTIELSEDPHIPRDTSVVVMIPDDDETDTRQLLKEGAEAAFTKLWDNKGDEVWRDYL